MPDIPAGAIFRLRAEAAAALAAGDPLRPHVMLQIGEEGAKLPPGHAKRVSTG